MRVIVVEILLGHKATVREKATAEGFTHDWEVFVKSESGALESFIDRVVFQLHDSFQRPRRVVKEPPYSVRESGYAGFILNIEVMFRNKEEPKKASFEYDLFLQTSGPTINHNRKEKLAFSNPSDDFAKKLFKAGGHVKKGEEGSSKGENSHSSHGNQQAAVTSSGGGKSSKHSITVPSSSSHPNKASPRSSSSFESLFGTPIKRGTSGGGGGSSSSSSVGSSSGAVRGMPPPPPTVKESRKGRPQLTAEMTRSLSPLSSSPASSPPSSPEERRMMSPVEWKKSPSPMELEDMPLPPTPTAPSPRKKSKKKRSRRSSSSDKKRSKRSPDSKKDRGGSSGRHRHHHRDRDHHHKKKKSKRGSSEDGSPSRKRKDKKRRRRERSITGSESPKESREEPTKTSNGSDVGQEMRILKDLHGRIGILDDPDKLQEIVDIVESAGKDAWNTDSGISFDFDLCKLSPSTIRRLAQAVLFS